MIPNLDALTEDELMAFWSKYHRATRKDAVELVGVRKGYVKVAAIVANYACNKAVAMACRKKGDIQAALIYEHSADLCYNQIPPDLKW